VELFCNGKTIFGSDDGNWKVNFNYRRIGSLRFSTKVKIGGLIFNGRDSIWKIGGKTIDCQN